LIHLTLAIVDPQPRIIVDRELQALLTADPVRRQALFAVERFAPGWGHAFLSPFGP